MTREWVGWFCIPDLPHHRSGRFLTPEEKECAVKRLGEARRQTWDLSVFRRVLLSWQFWLLPTIFMRMSLYSINTRQCHIAQTLN